MAKKKAHIVKVAPKKAAPKKVDVIPIQSAFKEAKLKPKKAPEITRADLEAVQTLLDKCRAELAAERRGAPRRKITKRPLSISGVGR